MASREFMVTIEDEWSITLPDEVAGHLKASPSDCLLFTFDDVAGTMTIRPKESLTLDQSETVEGVDDAR